MTLENHYHLGVAKTAGPRAVAFKYQFIARCGSGADSQGDLQFPVGVLAPGSRWPSVGDFEVATGDVDQSS